MRSMVLRQSLFALLVLPGCWAEFPDHMLEDDGAVDSGDARVTDQSGAADTGRDTVHPDAGTHDTRPTDSAGPDQKSKPDMKLTTCKAHNACISEICTAQGVCAAAADVAYVDVAGCATGKKTGTIINPFCGVGDAVGGGRRYILVRKGTYSGDLAITGTHDFYAEVGTILKPTGCGTLKINGAKAGILLSGFEIHGQINISGGATVKITQSTIGPSACMGLSATGGTVSLERSLIINNAKGGISLMSASFSVINNYILDNGSAATSFGGAALGPKTPYVFINNTLAGNKASGASDKTAGAVVCLGGVTLKNSILWANTPTSKSKQYSPTCSPQYCDLMESGTPALTNINVSPAFAGTGKGYLPYRLQATSPLKNKGTTVGAPTIDFEGKPRVGNPDIGADET